MTLRHVVLVPALGAILVACGARSIPDDELQEGQQTIDRDVTSNFATSKPPTTTPSSTTTAPPTKPPPPSGVVPTAGTGTDVPGVAPITNPPTTPGVVAPTMETVCAPIIPLDPPMCTDLDAPSSSSARRADEYETPPLQRIVIRLFCGDGRVTQDETCDDGNGNSGDGCTETCDIEPYYECPNPGEACVFTGVCGDGVVAGPEQCEPTDAPGCSSSCELEEGWVCPLGQPCLTVCGDGLHAGDEACDDGNNVNDDGCDATCRVEWAVCRAEGCPSSGGGVCGDGAVDVGEACDDAGLSATCSDTCQWLPQCNADTCTSTCGDGVVLDEACDDGNVIAGDGCDPTCSVEQGFACTIVPLSEALRDSLPSDLDLGVSECVALCGDAILSSGEQCDLGERNGENGAYCRSDCTLTPYCGDGVTSDGEACDDGRNVGHPGDTTSCPPGCIFPGYCGDAIVQPERGEVCDNGKAYNTGAYEGCTSFCTLSARCGDGVVQECGNESCDSAGANDGTCVGCRIRTVP